ncbi:MAG TPA: tetratricopeptide repeat protein, partial [Parasegetibacter sp.]
MRENPFREDRNELEELLKQYDNYKSGRGHSFLEEDAFERIIDYFDEQEKMTQALEAADTAIELFPYSATLLIKKADLLLATRKYQDALNVLEMASLLDAGDINLYILKTDAYLALDQQQKAVELLEEALHLFEGEERIEMLFELADVYDDYEEFEKVFDCLKLILEEDPINEEALYKICFWTDFTGRNAESIELHKKIIEEYPYCELAWFNLGAAYQSLKLYEKSIDAYQYAIAIEEKFDFAYRNMGDAFIRIRKYREAIEALEKVLELSRPEDVIYEAIGHCYDKIGNYAQARIHYRKASHLNPSDSKLYYKIACTYMNEEQWESAAKQLDSAMRIHRNAPEYSLAMGECKLQLGDTREAIQYLSTVVRLKPKLVAGWETLIRCLYAAGYFEEALEQIEAAQKATSRKPVFAFYLVVVLIAKGKTKEAILQLEQALELAPRQFKKM